MKRPQSVDNELTFFCQSKMRRASEKGMKMG
jgi:hypothetical protein